MSTPVPQRRIVSFDLDGTLVETTYTNWVWEVGVPELYAKKNGISLEAATALIVAQYQSVGDESTIWYDIGYWFNLLDLPGTWQDLLDRNREKIRLFPEAVEVLEALRSRYELIITSNAAREFVEREVGKTGIANYFSRIISATSDFRQVKKTADFYEKLCTVIGTDPARLIHVGDHVEHDFKAPRKIGIQAYHLDRDGGPATSSHCVSDLREFARLLV